jgi:hypothetical protein
VTFAQLRGQRLLVDCKFLATIGKKKNILVCVVCSVADTSGRAV